MLNIPGYTIQRELGSGGMAVVYLATQDSLQREVALKVMRNVALDGSDNNRFIEERFIHEGHDLASLVHPNIVTIHDISHTDEYYYYSMELLKEGSLSERLAEGVSLVGAFDIILQIGSALECAHQNNIIHRDLKPSNILFRDNSTPILTDFGIAKNTNRETKLTRTGALLGTAWYMSPEQCRGLDLDGRSDLYSLCILFFELIAGYLPFDADSSIAVAMKQITEPVPQLPENLLALQPIIDIALSKNAEDRFPSVAEFCLVLKNKLYQDDSLQDSMHLQTQKLSQDVFSQNSVDRFSRTTEPNLDLVDSDLVMPSEEEFWESEGRLKRSLLLFLLMVSIIFAWQYYNPNWHDQIWRGKPQSVEIQRFVPVLMRQAERQLNASQFFLPAGNNVYETLTNVLSMDPRHLPALQMMDDIATIFEIRARQHLSHKKYAQAVQQIEQGVKFSVRHKGLMLVQKTLQNEILTNRRNETIAVLLVKVDAFIEKKHYIKPANGNAMQGVNEILVLDINHSKALGYKSQLKQFTLLRLKFLLEQEKFEQLTSEIKWASTAFPDSQKVKNFNLKFQQALKPN